MRIEKTFDVLHFVADNAGLSTFEAIEKAYNMGVSEQEPCEDEYIKVPKKALKYRTAGMVAYNAEWLKNHFDIERAVICGEQELCEDAISRQEVLEVQSKYAEYVGATKFWQMRDDIKGLQPVTPQPKTGKWIPVSERLPKAGEYVGDVAKYYLVQNEYGDMLVARYTHNEYWEQIYQLKPISDEIVAWMPLPQAYKAESEDNR